MLLLPAEGIHKGAETEEEKDEDALITSVRRATCACRTREKAIPRMDITIQKSTLLLSTHKKVYMAHVDAAGCGTNDGSCIKM